MSQQRIATTCSTAARRAHIPWVMAAWFVLGWGVLPARTHSAGPENTSLRLAITWGNGTPRAWAGAITVDNGVFSQPVGLGVDADQPGTYWIDQGQLHVRQRLPKSYDGVRFLVDGASDAVLHVRFKASDGRPSHAVVDVPLAQLRREPLEIPIDDQNNRLLIRRVPTDMLRVRLDRDHLVFAPGERLHFDLLPHALPVEDGAKVDIALELCRARSTESLWSAEHTVTAGAAILTRHEVPMPQVEGVYELSITANYSPGLNWQQVARPSWTWRQTLATRRIQCVVVSKTPPPVAVGPESGLRELEMIDPTDPARWRERWQRWTTLSFPELPQRFPGLTGRLPHGLPRLSETMPRLGHAVAPLQAPFQHGLPRLTEGVSRLGDNLSPWGNAQGRHDPRGRWGDGQEGLAALSSWVNPWSEPTFGSGHLTPYDNLPHGFVRLAPRPADGEPSWQAYFLPIQSPGKPHVLEIEYLDLPQTLAVSIVEPNAVGAVGPPTLDFGVDVPEAIVKLEQPRVPGIKKYRIVFWPRTESPVILINNRRTDVPSYFGKIRLYGGWDALPRRQPPGGRPGRLAAAYLDRPRFPESFAASQTVGELTRAGVDDWVTFYEGGVRMVEYLDHVGYGGMMLSVWSDGSAIYPSRHLESTALHDSGIFLGVGHDPIRKDVVEMLLRLFDRGGLQLIPSLDFCSPLPELEAVVRRGGPEATGVYLVGPEGRTRFDDRASPDGQTPNTRNAYYNVLNPRVQEAMLNVVREFVLRYGDHPSLQGLAMQLSADGYAILPGPEWGLDDDTIARFVRDTGFPVPETGGPDRYAARARYLETTCPRPWLAWRAAEVRRFYERVQREVNDVRPDLRLYLAGGTMLAGETTQRHLRPRLPQTMTLAEAMLRLGVDPALYDGDPRIVLLRPERIAPEWSLVDEAVALEMLRLADVDSAFTRGGGPAGAIFQHGLHPVRLASFERRSPYSPTYTWLAPQWRASGDTSRRRFVHALAAIDAQVVFDGGRRLATDQDPALDDFLAAYRHLPPIHFEQLAASPDQGTQPVCVRFARGADGTYAYLVNDAPFPVRASLRIAAKPGCRLDELTGARTIEPPKADSRGMLWAVDMKPYDLVVLRLSDPAAKLYDVRVDLPVEARKQLEERVSALSDRIAASRMLSMPIPGFERIDFEETAPPSPGQSGTPPLPSGWTALSAPGAGFVAGADTLQARSGVQSLRLTSSGGAGTVVSRPLASPPTGRLALLAWVGVPANHTGPVPFAFSVQEAETGRTLAQVPIERALPPTATEQVGGVVWRQVLVSMPELPLDRSRAVQLRFDLLGPATVWVDQVEVYGLSFSRNERIELSGLVGLADYSLRRGKVTDAIRLLESYWPRFLLTYVPKIEGIESESPRAEPPTTETREAKQEDAGFFGRMRSYIPSSMRFF